MALWTKRLRTPEIASSWTPVDNHAKAANVEQVTEEKKEPREYHPLSETLRLYAGWLLAWYLIIYAIGSYQLTRTLPFELPFVAELFFSPLVLSFAVAAFLFLMLSSVYRRLGRRRILGLLLTVGGVLLFLAYRSNV